MGESAAAALLESEGYALLARNYRTRSGEVDLIAHSADTLCFIEVKCWGRYGFDSLEYALGPRKRRAIIETSKQFLAQHREYSSMRVRFDLVLVRPDTLEARWIHSAFWE
jgi:putative endonuclease